MYEQIVANAMTVLSEQGCTYDLEDMPNIVVEQELVEGFQTYVGMEEAVELENALVRADLER